MVKLTRNSIFVLGLSIAMSLPASSGVNIADEWMPIETYSGDEAPSAVMLKEYVRFNELDPDATIAFNVQVAAEALGLEAVALGDAADASVSVDQDSAFEVSVPFQTSGFIEEGQLDSAAFSVHVDEELTRLVVGSASTHADADWCTRFVQGTKISVDVSSSIIPVEEAACPRSSLSTTYQCREGEWHRLRIHWAASENCWGP